MSKENEIKAEEKAMKQQVKEAAGIGEDGELNPAEMKEITGGRHKKNKVDPKAKKIIK